MDEGACDFNGTLLFEGACVLSGTVFADAAVFTVEKLLFPELLGLAWLPFDFIEAFEVTEDFEAEGFGPKELKVRLCVGLVEAGLRTGAFGLLMALPQGFKFETVKF